MKKLKTTEFKHLPKGVLVFNRYGEKIAEYPSVKAVAEEYHTSDDVIYRYVKSGNLWKKELVMFDYVPDAD